MDISKLIGIFTIPQSGCSFATIAGEANTVAQVILAPGDGLGKYHRRLAEAHPVVMCAVRGDLEPPAAPDAFHRTTLRWALYSADYIAIWSAPFPEFYDDVGRAGMQAVDDGRWFLVTIETTAERAPEWAAFVQRWKRKTTPVRVYGPEIAGGVQ
jgi:hypothetical protein